jgi:hypothetical protein
MKRKPNPRGCNRTDWRRRLPADPEGMNNDRAAWAEQACLAFVIATGTDWADVLQDLLADLMHLADRDTELDFDRDLARASDHYAEETRKDGVA